jgi:hypothetical protein
MESWAIEHSVNMEHRVMQDLRGKKSEEGKGPTPSKSPLHGGAQGVLPRQKKRRSQKMCQRELAEKKKRKSGIIGLTVYGP